MFKIVEFSHILIQEFYKRNKNKNLISDYKSGNIKIKKFFVGEAMKEFKGRAEPKLINKIIDDLFSKI